MEEQKPSHLHRVRSGLSNFKTEFKTQTSTAIVAAFGLIIALAWKDVITTLMQSVTTAKFFENNPYISPLISAALITAVSVLGLIVVARWTKKKE
jgi:hypothetical protein